MEKLNNIKPLISRNEELYISQDAKKENALVSEGKSSRAEKISMRVTTPGGALPYKRLMGMCRWMGSYFHDWTDYNGVAFSKELLEWGRTFSDFWGRELFIFTVSKRTRIFVQ